MISEWEDEELFALPPPACCCLLELHLSQSITQSFGRATYIVRKSRGIDLFD